MNGLAVSAAILFALLLPGQIAHYIYKRRTSAWANSASNLYGLPTSLVWGLVFAVPLNTIWGLMATFGLGVSVDYDALLSLLINQNTDTHWFANDQFDSPVYMIWVCIYWFSQCLAGFAAGHVLDRLAQRLNWPQQIALRSNGATWHRIFLAMDWSEKPDAVTASAVVTEDSKVFLYAGIVNTYDLDANGNLQRILLEGAHRREFPAADGGSEWKELRGEFFVVNCERVQTIDIDYVWIAEPRAVRQVLAQDLGICV